jgi:hypothetical protein
MPFKSKAQRRKFAQLLVEGKITDEQYEEWNRSTGRKELPERVGQKRAPNTKRPAKRSPAKKRAARATKTARKSSTRTAAKRTVRTPPARRKRAKSS